MKRFAFLDDNTSVFFERQLETIAAKTYDQKFPELKAMNGALPISTEGGPDSDTYTFRSFTEAGIAELVTSYADNAPRVDVSGVEETVKIRSIVDAYGYNIMDIRFAAKQGIPLVDKKAVAARRAIERRMESLAWSAKKDIPKYQGLTGVFYHPNIISYEAKETAPGSGITKWANKTNAQIIEDINILCNISPELTNGIEEPDTFRCPKAQFTLISTTKVDSESDMTILDWVKKVNPHITKWDWLSDCKGLPYAPSTGEAGSFDVAIAYKNDINKLQLHIPSPFDQLPPEPRNFEVVVNCLARFACVEVFYPMSIAVVESI